jgi:hypothetical protein
MENSESKEEMLKRACDMDRKMTCSFMDQYSDLTGKYYGYSDNEIERYKSLLQLPNIEYPHYEPLIIGGIVVHECLENDLLDDEKFLENKSLLNNNFVVLKVSNYGRVQFNNKILKPNVVGVFKHGLTVLIEGYGTKGVHRLEKETFGPIENMNELEVHHINNNGLDNRLENLIWVSRSDHRKIDSEFNKKLQKIKNITDRNSKM